MANERPSLTIQNAKILGGPWSNFRGEKQKFSPAGSRFFNIELTQAEGEALLAEHWNVKAKRMTEEDTEQKYSLQIKVNFDSRVPPQVWTITSAGKLMLRQDMVGELDYLEIEKADIAFVGHQHGMNTEDPLAMSAYLTRLYATIHEDPLDLLYSRIPRIDAGPEVEETPYNGPDSVPPAY